MPDYAKMYRKLFNSQTEAISIMMQAQKETEEMYVSAPDPEIHLAAPSEPEDD